MTDCDRCGAVSVAAHECFGLKPMAIAPEKPLLAVHFERGPVEISPYHEANYWLSAAQPGVKHWYLTDDEESGSFDDSEFDGWLTEQAE